MWSQVAWQLGRAPRSFGAMEDRALKASSTSLPGQAAGQLARAGWISGALAIGALASTCTDLALAAIGQATVDGPTLGLVLVPLIAALAVPGARAMASEHGALVLLVLGAAWMLASLFDQHLTGVVTIDGGAGEFVHHGAALAPLWVGSTRLATSLATRESTPRRH